jgi:hypothetical protein
LCCEDSLAAPNSTSVVNGKTTSAETKRVFVHLAMCTPEASEKEPRINPPLGWVLSKATRDKFKSRKDKPSEGILGKCGNDKELGKLKEALGVKANEAEADSNPKPSRS